jgi:hypothetical protein
MRYLPGVMALSFALVACNNGDSGQSGQNIQSYISDTEISFPAKGKVPDELNLFCAAKLDTGADTTSFHAENISYNHDKSEVSFEVYGQTLRRPVIRVSKIKTRGAEGKESEPRPVIEVSISINGSEPIITQANLTNRSNFRYPLLIGRNTLEQGKIIVDSASTQRPVSPNLKCKGS